MAASTSLHAKSMDTESELELRVRMTEGPEQSMRTKTTRKHGVDKYFIAATLASMAIHVCRSSNATSWPTYTIRISACTPAQRPLLAGVRSPTRSRRSHGQDDDMPQPARKTRFVHDNSYSWCRMCCGSVMDFSSLDCRSGFGTCPSRPGLL